MTYRVFITPEAKQRILEQAQYIATEQGAPDRAAEWLGRIFTKAESLEDMPRRFPRAPEDTWCDQEIRHLPIGQFILYFTIDDEAETVTVVHARHGRQLSHPDDFRS